EPRQEGIVISDSVPAQTPEPQSSGGEPSITPTSRPRWLIPGAAAVVVLAVGIGLVVGLTLTAKRTGGAVGAASYVPADSANYYGAVPDVIVLVGVKDATAAGALNDRVRADLTKAGATVTSTSHSGVTIWSVSGGSTETSAGLPQHFAWAITADQLVAGTTVELVGNALDSHSGATASLASRDEFNAGLSGLPAD